MLVARAHDAPAAAIANRRRRGTARRVRAHRRGATLELFDVAARLARRTIDVRRALRAPSAHAPRSRRGAVGVHRALRASPRDEIADRLALPAVAVLIALDTCAGRRIAELGASVSALRALGALRVALVVARPTRGRARSAVGVVAARFAASREAERFARAAVAVAETLDASERPIAFTSAARARRAGEVPAAADEAGVVAVASARDDDDCREREGHDPGSVHLSYGSVPPR